MSALFKFATAGLKYISKQQFFLPMKGLLFKWLFLPLIWLCVAAKTDHHPIFVSVTEIEHNAKAKTLEISCKIFTDDFEKTLRAAYKTHVDLLDPEIKPAMDKLVNDYVQKHLKIAVDGKQASLKYLGYEKIEEGIYSYFQADNIPSVKKIEVTDDVLFEFNEQQMSIVHVIVNGNRQTNKLSGSEKSVAVSF